MRSHKPKASVTEVKSNFKIGKMILSLVIAQALVVANAFAMEIPGTDQIVLSNTAEMGTSAFPFDMSQVILTNGRLMENQNRTYTYIKWINVDRLLYVFRENHKLSTQGAQPNGGWDAPDFPFRSHVQGHFLTAWSHCYAVTKDETCRKRAQYFVSELAKCQANNRAAGFSPGYLSGFPESEFIALENRTIKGGSVPYYAVHKTLAGLLDVWQHLHDENAQSVLLSLAEWVETRTKKLTHSQMQSLMGTEFGGMNEVMADLYHQTGDHRWLVVAQKFDHGAVFDPLAFNADRLSGLHANTQIPKWIGAAREYKATGNTRYRDIARNAWSFTVDHHSYAIGGNSQAEHFHEPDAIAKYLARDTSEGCNTYNMLKLTRELWTIDPRPSYFDFYERALLNHLLGQQNQHDPHGHITYFTPLKPGLKRGVGPLWGGGEWSTDYNSFWCCQGTGLETNTKLMDSIYFHNGDSTLFVNLFAPSILKWTQKGIRVMQSTSFPVSDSTTLIVSGKEDHWTMRIRIPSWTSNAEITINGQSDAGISTKSGTYTVLSRVWKSGDVVKVRLPMTLRTIPANDKPTIAAIAHGPIVLSGNYGNSSLKSVPELALNTIRRLEGPNPAFSAIADGLRVILEPFYEAQGFNYNVYWTIKGQLPASY
jgi:uncharacterized protein